MTRLLLIHSLAALLFVGIATPASAQPLTTRAQAVEERVSRFSAYLRRLEGQLEEQGKRIARLKRQRPGVGRDLQLKAALRTSQQLAGRLTHFRARLRTLRTGLLRIYAAAIAGAKDAATRRAWRKRRQALVNTMRSRPSRIVTGAKANPLDSAEDLREKADLLTDSAAKIRRRLARLSRRISRIERRTRLRRHGRAATDNPFVEDTTRRLGGTRRASPAAKATPPSGTAGAKTGRESDPSPAELSGGGGPATPPPSGGSNGSPGSNGHGSYDGMADAAPAPTPAPQGLNTPGRATPIAPPTLSRGLDPQTLAALAAARRGSPASRLAALKRARASLRRLAAKLGARAKALRLQAKRRALPHKR